MGSTNPASDYPGWRLNPWCDGPVPELTTTTRSCLEFLPGLPTESPSDNMCHLLDAATAAKVIRLAQILDVEPAMSGQ